jgi:hypothetical protein
MHYFTGTALEEAEIIPDKHADTGIKPLAMANGHGRYVAVTTEDALASVGECPLGNGQWPRPLRFWFLAVSLPKRPKWFKKPVGTSRRF